MKQYTEEQIATAVDIIIGDSGFVAQQVLETLEIVEKQEPNLQSVRGVPDIYYMKPRQFIEDVFEVAFGDDAINKKYDYSEALARLREFSDNALKWEEQEDQS